MPANARLVTFAFARKSQTHICNSCIAAEKRVRAANELHPVSICGSIAPMAEDSRRGGDSGEHLDLTRLIPDLLTRYFDFFRPGHNDGVVPARIKELARLTIAALNQCDT